MDLPDSLVPTGLRFDCNSALLQDPMVLNVHLAQHNRLPGDCRHFCNLSLSLRLRRLGAKGESTLRPRAHRFNHNTIRRYNGDHHGRHDAVVQWRQAVGRA